MAIISISESAQGYVDTVLSSNPGMALVVGIDNKGCSGHKYTFDLVRTEDVAAQDEVAGSVVVRAASVMGLLGSTLDLVGNQFEQHLVWDNPMAKSHCGCGQSFKLDAEATCGQ